MAGRGPAPKEKHARERDDQDFTEVRDDGALHGPELPEGVLPKDASWHPQTLAWWESLRRSPLLASEPDMGWQFLIDTALLHHTMWSSGRWEHASEVRLRVAKFGATPEDRMRLKVKVETPNPAAWPAAVSQGVTELRSRRSRLTG